MTFVTKDAEMVMAGRIRRDGTGRKHQPFRYWLAEKEEQGAQDPLHKYLHPDPVELEELLRQRRERGGAA